MVSPAAITYRYASTYAHFSAHKPYLECASCSTRIAVNPVSIDCFPSSARQATAWYDQQLLVLTEATRHSGPVPIQAHCAALKQLHFAGGVRPPGIRIKLSDASHNWQQAQVCSYEHSCANCQCMDSGQ